MHAVIAANRFGLGARPGEIDAIGQDPRGWLKRQAAGSRPLPEAIRALPPSTEVFGAYADGQEQRRRERQEPPDQAAIAQRIVNAVRQKLAPMYAQQVAARYRTAIATDEPFRERLIHFWTNHFAVSADKIAVLALAAPLENEAVRPHLAGRFLDMLMAVESHPAMILYLDNQASIGPGSRLGTRAQRRASESGRKLDINENLAREILELHTLGVNGGYAQSDVTTFALALTGWSIGGNRGLLMEGEPGQFIFREAMHEPGPKTLLGKRYAQEGVEQPRAILHDLARHPATARHIATKLVRHFVADEPPAAAVERVARAFLDSDGDLPTVHNALIDSAEAWSQPLMKFKTPHEFVVSSFRMLDFVPQQPQQFIAPFQLLGQRPYAPGSPAGWDDVAAAWDGPDALLKRIEWATAVADRVSTGRDPNALAKQALGRVLNEKTRTAISRAASAAQAITLLLASPEFQRR
jgi:uncharacterized protein (DUF1800 family)